MGGRRQTRPRLESFRCLLDDLQSRWFPFRRRQAFATIVDIPCVLASPGSLLVQYHGSFSLRLQNFWRSPHTRTHNPRARLGPIICRHAHGGLRDSGFAGVWPVGLACKPPSWACGLAAGLPGRRPAPHRFLTCVFSETHLCFWGVGYATSSGGWDTPLLATSGILRIPP